MTTTRTENYRFEDEFLKKVRESDVWEKLSSSDDLNWSESLIDKYSELWNWEELSSNGSIPWNESLIEKYKHKIHWGNFTTSIFNCRYSRRRGIGGFDHKSNEKVSQLLRKFNEYWDWSQISRHSELNFTSELLESFANKWVWKDLINNREVNWNYQLFEHFRVYIPMLDIENFTRSELWNALIEVDYKIMTGKLLSGQ